MPIPINAPPETLADDLTMSLWRERATRRILARRKAWEPSIDDCRAIAERQVQDLRNRLTPLVVQRVAQAHSINFGDPRPVPAGSMPIWRRRPPGPS